MAEIQSDAAREALKRFIAGDRESFTRFYHATRNALYFYVRAQIGLAARPHAEEVLQEFYVKICRKPELFADAAHFLGYLYTALRRDVIRFNENRQVREQNEIHSASATGAWSAAPDAEDGRELMEWLESLPAGPREVIALKLNDDLTFEEISRLTGQPLPTLAAQYRRGIQSLRERWLRKNRGSGHE